MLNIKEFAKEVKEELQEKYPDAKWSVTTPRADLQIALMSYPEEVRGEDGINEDYIQGADYMIDSYMNENALNEKGKEIFTAVKEIATSKLNCTGDIQYDTYNQNYYVSINLGKYNRPFEVK